MKDMIDRQEAIEALGKRPGLAGDCEWEIAARKQYDADRVAIESVPSAQPERKTGRWEWDEESGSFLCSECNSGYRDQPTLMGKPLFEYCPMCGADMKKEKENDLQSICMP